MYFLFDLGWTLVRGVLYVLQKVPGGTEPQIHIAVTSIMHPYMFFPPSLTIPGPPLLLPKEHAHTLVSVLVKPNPIQAAIGCPILALHLNCVSSPTLPCTLAVTKYFNKAYCLIPIFSSLCLFTG